MGVYLDYNASAPIDKRVLEKMIEVYQKYIGNADSRTHGYGEQSREIVENARKQVANLLGIDSSEIFFTSGATESNNIAIQGLKDYANATGKKHIITTAIEHKAVLETIKHMGTEGFDVDIIAPDHTGRINSDDVLDKVRDDTLLVSVMHVNNETGIIQPVKEIGDELQKKEVLFHIDATQSCGKLVDEIRQLNYNMLSFSAHKLRGPQGVGVLVLRKKGYKLPPVKQIMYGGQQEHGIRPGTIPVALVAGCGAACEIAEKEKDSNRKAVESIKKSIISLIDSTGLDYSINGDSRYCIDSTLNICIKGVSAEALMISSKQFCGISNGSACTSKNYSPSYVLMASGVPEDEIEDSIRISWGADSDRVEVEREFMNLLDVAKQIRG